jgi:hypothetical protein
MQELGAKVGADSPPQSEEEEQATDLGQGRKWWGQWGLGEQGTLAEREEWMSQATWEAKKAIWPGQGNGEQ